MEYVYASLLLHAAKKEISEATITSVLKSAGITANPAQAKSIVAALENVNIEEAIKSAALPVAAPAASSGPSAKEAKKEEKKEEKEEKKEEVAGLGALFG
jgi:large subunit ribosomal protein L12